MTFVDAFFGTKWMIILNRRLSWQVNELRLFQAKKVKINCHVFRDIQLIIKRLHYVSSMKNDTLATYVRIILFMTNNYLFRNQEFIMFIMLKISYEGKTYNNKKDYLNRQKKTRVQVFCFCVVFLDFFKLFNSFFLLLWYKPRYFTAVILSGLTLWNHTNESYLADIKKRELDCIFSLPHKAIGNKRRLHPQKQLQIGKSVD